MEQTSTGSLSIKPKIGILMLNTTFPRIKGDIGNKETFSFPVRYKIVQGATVERVVEQHDPTLITPFIKAAHELEEEGVQAITTSCGFLALFQEEIAKQLTIPFYSSSLLQIPLVHTLTGKQGPIGILTANKSTLSREHLHSAGVENIPLVIGGLENSPAFRTVFLEGATEINKEKIEAEMVEQAVQLVSKNPDIKALVFECTNMPPFRESVKKATGLPVFDIVTLTNYVHEALV